ncbi:hypothetical protein MSG28_001630 [Choristoneura fumiferana]|uniref:Uncharacterized protein n=1 Tax=Choristoneura fumiferana TaxID=7141 RepID=A0ACC0KVD5_CHOFU|nr:hypothetical protein MSG28_001630 [Choristoneura fumiferana]
MGKAAADYRPFVECRSMARLAADGKEIPKRKNFENRITLIGTDDSVSITDLKNAQNLSQKRELKLVKIQDVGAKTRRPVYKLMTNAEYHSEELESRKQKQTSQQNTLKGEKLLTLSTKIGEHDLMTGVKKMLKLLEKQHQVRVVIAGESGQETQSTEKIYSIIERGVKSVGKVVQKRNKGNTLRFQILPSNESSTQGGGDRLDSSPEDKEKGPL